MEARWDGGGPYFIKPLVGFVTGVDASQLHYNPKRTTTMIFKARMYRLLEDLRPAPSDSSSQSVRSNSPF